MTALSARSTRPPHTHGRAGRWPVWQHAVGPSFAGRGPLLFRPFTPRFGQRRPGVVPCNSFAPTAQWAAGKRLPGSQVPVPRPP